MPDLGRTQTELEAETGRLLAAFVLECHHPEERTRVQSVNDFLVFGTMALGSFFSGGLLTSYGWDVVLWVLFAPLLVALVVRTPPTRS